ncbi:MAG: methionine--tRNA ligase subunit beta, partial [Bacteroidetes bacterium QS_8_64_10]
VIYVWFDAPIGYISATKEWAEREGDPDRWKRYWQDEDTRLVHFIGKDNIVFHCLMFPAMLMEHGEYVLPDNVPANEFLNMEARKLSTSRGWAVWLNEYLDDFPPDLLRYTLAATLPETKDASFSWSDFQRRVNNELADVLGNFVNRALTFAERFFDGEVPPLRNASDRDRDVLDRLAEFPEKIGAAYDNYRMREAVGETMALARMGNKYFNDTEPWHTRSGRPQAAANTVHVSLQICAALAVLMEPVLPESARRLRRMLRLETRSSEPGEADDLPGWDDAGAPLLREGHALGEAEILFHKIEDEQIDEQMAKLEEQATPADDEADSYEELGDTISFGDFTKLDLRTGTVVAADSIEKADKLVRVDVDLGFEERQILAGVAEQYAPGDLVGKKVVVVANLAPKEMFGMKSEGMMLMAEDREGQLTFVGADAENGAVVR